MAAQPTGQAGPPPSNLWEAALQDLDPEERHTISKHIQHTKPTDVIQIVETKEQEAWNNRMSFKKKSGEVVFLYDIFAKVARWVKKFVEIGDAAVQYDPAHAALPWAAVRFILQASINDILRQAAVLDIVEDVARAIPLGAVHECLYLTGPSAAAESLKAGLTKLYTLCWSSLAKALHYHDQRKMRHVLKSVLDSDHDLNALSERIANQWTLVERSATLVRSEGLILHISKSQNQNEELLRMMDDIKMPVSRIETYVEEAQDTLSEMNRDRILDSISTIPYSQHHAKVSRNVLPGTGKWLLDHQVVRNWFSSSASEILWLHGIPGSGKSCLVSVILEKLIEESAHCPSSHPVYFYCNRNPAEKERAHPTQILRSILRQLSTPRSTKILPRSVMDKFDKERGSFFDLGDTLDLIIDIIKSRTITFIVLDALDECDVSRRFELTHALETILGKSQSLVKIFVSSRNDLDLVCWLRDYPNKEILSSDNQVDLAAFVDDEVDKRVDGKPRRLLSARKISDVLRDDIKQTLKAQAQGMFRWAELQLQYLCKLLTEEDVRQRLGALPKDLTGIYDDIYQRNMSDLRDTNPQYEADAKKVFHLMLSSDEPWNPVDMANMLEPAPNAVLRQPEKVFGLTFHLITHDKELNVLRFAHLSVREYLETNLSEFTPSKSMEASVLACFDYLEETRDIGFRPLSYPSQRWFKHVANLSIGEMSAQFADRLTQFLVYNVLTFKSWLKDMTENGEQTFLNDEFVSASTLTSSDGTAIFTACVLGLEGIVSHLIEAKPSSVHARNLQGHSTLLVACRWNRSTDIVSRLLQNGAAVNDRVGQDHPLTVPGTALSVQDQSIPVIRELLENGADPDCTHFEGYDGEKTPLHIAIWRCCTEAVELLLKHGADPNLAKGTTGILPLHLAVVRYNYPCKIVKKLLEAGASVASVNKNGDDALRLAARCGHADFVTTLLSFGADINARDMQRAADRVGLFRRFDNVSALFLAIDQGRDQIARQLLSHGAHPVPRSYMECNIFEKLMSSKNAELAKSLLLSPNQDRCLITIIQAARLLGENEVMKQLKILKDQKNDEQELDKAMDLAAKASLTKVFKWLIDHSHDYSLRQTSGYQALAGTARRGQVEMFKILWTSLLRSRPTSSPGDDISAALRDSDVFIASLHTVPEFESQTRYSFLLYNAAKGGSAELFHLILTEGSVSTMGHETGPEEVPKAMNSSVTALMTDSDKHESLANEIRDHGAWYLYAAVKAGHADMVDLLLRLGANANAIAPNCHDQNALCTALIKRKDPNIIKLLVMGGADVNARLSTDVRSCHCYGTALVMALCREQPYAEEIMLDETPATLIELLLQHGADANAADDNEGSILQLAISQGHIGATELLLSYGADVNEGGGTAGTPLIAAMEYRVGIDARQELTEILLKHGADTNKSGGNRCRRSPLIAAVLLENYSTCTRFIELLLKHGADVNAEHPGPHQTAVRAALSRMGNIGQEMFQYLLIHGADVSATGRDGTQPLYAACASGHCDEQRAEYLLSHGADVNASGGEYGNALQAACASGCPSTIVELLVAKGADVNAEGGRFGNALQAASHAGDIRTMEILLANGANVHTNDGEYGHALQAAAMSDNPGLTMKLLLSHGANINACGRKYGTALQAACANSNSAKTPLVIRLLLSRGANLNMRGGEYGYALICAVTKRWYLGSAIKQSPVNILLDGGADINCSHEKYGNALYAACYNGDTHCMELLIKRGISLTQLTGEHEHALFVACLESKPNVVGHSRKDGERVRVLLDNGVDVNIRGKRYSCALEVAIKAENLAAAKLLIERGADVRVETENDGFLLDIAIRSSSSEMVDLLRANGA